MDSTKKHMTDHAARRAKPMAHGGGTSRATRILFLTMLLGALAGSLDAQTTSATLSGTVHDTAGAVIAQAKITLKNTTKGSSRTTTTDGEGHYNFSSVEPGTYEVRAESGGFSTEVKSGVVV